MKRIKRKVLNWIRYNRNWLSAGVANAYPTYPSKGWTDSGDTTWRGPHPRGPLADLRYHSFARRYIRSMFCVARMVGDGSAGGCNGSSVLGGTCVPGNAYFCGIGGVILISYQFPGRGLVQILRQAPVSDVYWVNFRVTELDLFKVTLTISVNRYDVQWTEYKRKVNNIPFCGDVCGIRVPITTTYNRSVIADVNGRTLSGRFDYLDNNGLINSDCYQGCPTGTILSDGTVVTSPSAIDGFDKYWFDKLRVYVKSYSALGANCGTNLTLGYQDNLIFSKNYNFDGGILENDCSISFSNIVKCNNTVLGKVYLIEFSDYAGVFHSDIGGLVLPNYANYPTVSIDTGTVEGGFKVQSARHPQTWYSVPFNYSSCECGDFNQQVTQPPSPLQATREWVGTDAGPFNPCKHIMKIMTLRGEIQHYTDYTGDSDFDPLEQDKIKNSDSPNRSAEKIRKNKKRKNYGDFRG
jgi:hypothetical protein